MNPHVSCGVLCEVPEEDLHPGVAHFHGEVGLSFISTGILFCM
jgi:hypothetical protein